MYFKVRIISLISDVCENAYKICYEDIFSNVNNFIDDGIIGFDCGSRKTNVTTISLLEVEACDIPEINVKKEEMDVQLMQLNDYTEAWAYQCKIEVQRTIYYCGMHTHI